MNNFSKKKYLAYLFVDTVNKNKNNIGPRIISWNSTDYIAPSRVTLSHLLTFTIILLADKKSPIQIEGLRERTE